MLTWLCKTLHHDPTPLLSSSALLRTQADHVFNALHAVEDATFATMRAHLSCILTPGTHPKIDSAGWSDDFFKDNAWIDRADRRKLQPRTAP